jgi:tetratricopeptide (TPR) repeat protein
MTALAALGRVAARLGRYDEAASALRRASELLTEHCRRDPTNIFLQGDRMVSRFDLSQILTRSGHHAEALAAYEEARSIAAELFGDDWGHGDEDVIPVSQLARAYSLRELGRVDEAEQAVRQVRASLGNRPQPLFELARYDARSAARLALAGGGADTVPALEDRAIDDLRRAIQGGFAESAVVKQDSSFDSLRGRDDFRLLLFDLAFPADPFAR